MSGGCYEVPVNEGYCGQFGGRRRGVLGEEWGC